MAVVHCNNGPGAALYKVMSVKPGDVFVSMWGYDQTNVDFYVVESVSASGKSVRVHKVATEAVDGTAPSGWDLIPLQGVRAGRTFTRKLRQVGDELWFSVTSYSSASPWDGVPPTATDPAFGH